MRTKSTLLIALAAGLATCLLLAAPVLGAQSYAEAAAGPNPDKPTSGVAPRPVAPVATDDNLGGLTFFTDRAVFEAMFPGLPEETFEEGNAPPGGFTVCNAPLSSAGDPACSFAPGDIIEGVAFTDNPPGPATANLILLGAGTSLNPTMALVSNTFADSFDILFDPPVTAAGMDLHSTPAPGQGPPDTLNIQVFDANNVSLGMTSAAASGPGNFWGVSSSTPIGRLSLLSTNNRAEGVDNISFSGEATLAVSEVTSVDMCASDPNNENGTFEPGELIEITVELTATAGDFTGISGTLTTTTPGVTIVSGNATWPDLTAGSSATGSPPFVIQLDETITCFTNVDLELTVTANEGGPFVTPISEMVGAPLEPNVPVAIPDANPAGVESDLVVADDVILTDVNVRVQISHTWVGDLLITLRAPDNTEVVLLDRPGVPMSGAGCADDNMDVTFDDASGFDPEGHCAATTPWFVGSANPVGSLAVLNGMSSAGTWSLFVSDNAGQDLGTIDNWELITNPPIGGVCNVCMGVDADLSITKTSNVQGSVSPGDPVIFTLTVTNNGPGAATGVVVTDTLPTQFDYVSDDCGGVFADPTFTWNVGNLAASASATCNITTTVAADAPEGPAINTATVSSNETDPVPGNNSEPETILIVGDDVPPENVLEIPTLDWIGLALLLAALAGAAIFTLRRA